MRLPLRLESGLLPFLGFPLRGSLSVSLASASLARSSTSGIARVSQVLDASLHAYHALRGPRQTLQDLTPTGPFVWASGSLTPSPSALSALTGLYQASGTAVYVIPCVRFNCFVRAFPPSSTAATLGMSGWLNLTQPGLSPGQKRQASLGALTNRASAAGGTRLSGDWSGVQLCRTNADPTIPMPAATSRHTHTQSATTAPCMPGPCPE